jgi:hypothetical protein
MPAPIKPMLGDLELSLVQRIETIEEQVLVDHAVPGLAGSLIQRLNRNPTQVRLHGVITSDEAKEGLEKLREKFHAAEPLLFAADIMAATEVQQVLIADLEVEELAGKPDRFEYWFTLKEYIPPPPDETEAMQIVNDEAASEAASQNDDRVEHVTGQLGVIEVEVSLASGERDFGIAEVEVEGTTDDGEPFSAVISEHVEGLFRLEDVPAGQYTVRAIRRE